jgi:hypothetical protein
MKFRYLYIEGGKSGYTSNNSGREGYTGINSNTLSVQKVMLLGATNNVFVPTNATSKSHLIIDGRWWDYTYLNAIYYDRNGGFSSVLVNSTTSNPDPDPQWLEIDLGVERDVRKVNIYNDWGWMSNPEMQHRLSQALLIGYNDRAARTDPSKRLWTATMPIIPVNSDIQSGAFYHQFGVSDQPTLYNFAVPSGLILLDTTLSNFNNITKNSNDAAFSLTTPTSNRNGAFTYSSSNTSVATISGNVVTIVGGGTATITATQTETDVYKAASITALITVSKVNPVLNKIDIVSVSNIFQVIINTTSNGLFTYSVSDSSAATVNSNNTLSFLKACDVLVTAKQAETAKYYSGEFTTIVSYTGI